MTREEAYYEAEELHRHARSWLNFGNPSPYCVAVRKRESDLRHWLLYCGKKPCDRKDWVCPPCDVEERLEWFFLNSWPSFWHKSKDELRRLMEKYNNTYPPITPWEEYKPHADKIHEMWRLRYHPSSKPEDWE